MVPTPTLPEESIRIRSAKDELVFRIKPPDAFPVFVFIPEISAWVLFPGSVPKEIVCS